MVMLGQKKRITRASEISFHGRLKDVCVTTFSDVSYNTMQDCESAETSLKCQAYATSA